MKIPIHRISPTILIGFALSAASATAAITYVDAVEGSSGNTFETGSPASDTSWVGPDATADSTTQWSKRGFATGGTVFEGQADGAGTPPELTIELSGLADGTYKVWVFYWDQITSATQNWIISTGLTSGSLTTYRSPGQPNVVGATTSGVSKATDLDFVTDPLTEELPNRAMYGVNLGDVEVSGGSVIQVFLGNDISDTNANRAWFDGVGYELVPEPSTALLMGLGVVGLMRRRRSS